MSTFDLKIVGGTIIDGTGKERFAGDVGIKDGRIVAVGECGESADETIDAEGALVTPGFTDMHTHYDGQISWDTDLEPSSLHGVTTAVLGSCGVGFAPVKGDDHQRLIELMEGVEDIPGSALAEGLTWNWESFPEYMDAIGALEHTIDFAAQVPHDPVRMFVMGERAVVGSRATEDEIAQMRQLVRASIEAGAVGFTTGRTDNHRTAQGSETPSAEAPLEELVGIAKAFEGLNKGVLQAVSDFDMGEGEEKFDGEFDLIERMAKAANRPISISLLQRDQAPGQWKRIMQRAEQAVESGVNIRLQVSPRGIGVLLGLEATFHPFMGFPSYKKIAHLPLPMRVSEMMQPEFKARILQEKSEKLSGDGSSVPPLADFLISKIEFIALRLYRLGEKPNYEPSVDDSLLIEARRTDRTALETVYDALLEREGKALLYFPIYNYSSMNLDDARTMLTHPLALPGLGDGGAHVGTICDASFPTFLLTHWGRDRAHGKIPLEKLVKMQAFDTARYFGFNDRGAIKAGLKADLNIIDLDRLQLHAPRLVKDLPAGGQRFLQRADGYRATLVSGTVIARGGKLTGARPGHLVRI